MNELFLAILIILAQSIVVKGIRPLVLIVYEQLVATLVSTALAFYLERITLCQLLLTISLWFVPATYQSIALNIQTAVIFVMALASRQEKIQCTSIGSQDKLWGVVISIAGAMVMVLWKGPTLVTLKSSSSSGSMAITHRTAAGIILTVAVLAGASWNILVGHVTRKYPAELSLAAMMNFFGTIQSAIVKALVEKRASWELKWHGGLVLFTILFGGTMVTGLSYSVQMWCIHKKGPIFTTAFLPLLIICTFLLETIFLKNSPHLGSIIGAMLAVVGLYFLLWEKAHDIENEERMMGEYDASDESNE
ncbi:WAT1-related protein At1g43650-like [Tasmannia lanceolata]|uniref:WAT1-related protein At1g43650-like n=1 Tax=Tasmannia lanceolata TaxID=3420 RepID=UPI004064412E